MAKYQLWQVSKGFIMETIAQYEANQKAYEIAKETDEEVMVIMFWNGKTKTWWIYPNGDRTYGSGRIAKGYYAN